MIDEKKLQEWNAAAEGMDYYYDDGDVEMLHTAVPALIAEVKRLRKIVLDVDDLTSPKNLNSWRFNDPEGCLCAVSDLVTAEASK